MNNQPSPYDHSQGQYDRGDATRRYANSVPPEKKKWSTTTKVLVGGLTLGALGFSIYSYFNWMKSQQQAANTSGGDDAFTETLPTTTLPKATSSTTTTVPYTPTAAPASDFPLKRGSKGTKVKYLQETLIAKYGKSILPKSGADSQFGPELEKALSSKSLPTSITEEQFKILTAVDTTDTATKLYNAAKKKDFNATIAALRTLQSTSDYKTVSEQFKAKRLNGVSTTLVTGLLNTFTDASQKQQIQIELSRMGLKYDGSKWSIPEGVAGIEPRQIITSKSTVVWQRAKHPVAVGADVVLGRELASSNGVTLFDTVDGFRLYVLTAHVRYI